MKYNPYSVEFSARLKYINGLTAFKSIHASSKAAYCMKDYLFMSIV